MQIARGVFCEEVAGKPRHLRGYTGFLANMHYSSTPGNLEFWRLFRARNVIDVGAAIGGWSLASMRAWGWDIEVHAFEPNPETLKDLRWNIGDLPNVHIWPYAAMNVQGKFPLVMPQTKSTYNVGQMSLVQSGEPRYEVEAVRLDDVLPDFCPDFIKIDVEGAEPNVLEGAEKMLRRSTPILYIETARTLKPVCKILGSLGYTFMLPTGRDHFFVNMEAKRLLTPAVAQYGIQGLVNIP